MVHIFHLIVFHRLENAWLVKTFFRSDRHTDVFFLKRHVERVMTLLCEIHQFFHEIRCQNITCFKFIRRSCFKVIIKFFAFQPNRIHFFFRKQSVKEKMNSTFYMSKTFYFFIAEQGVSGKMFVKVC